MLIDAAIHDMQAHATAKEASAPCTAGLLIDMTTSSFHNVMNAVHDTRFVVSEHNTIHETCFNVCE